ncbi:hypothetical protein Tco_1413122, partial [Tanacetum coccineum]
VILVLFVNSVDKSTFVMGIDGESNVNTKKRKDSHQVFDEMSMNKFLKRECTVDVYYAYFTSSFSNKDWDEGYLAELFIFDLQSQIGNTINMFKPILLSDAYHLARFQETSIKLMKGKTKASFTHTSCVKDSWEVMDENVSLMGIDKVCEKNVILENQDKKVDDGVKWKEEERNLVNGVAGMEVDSGGNGYSNSDVMDVDDVVINLRKEDANRAFHEEVKNRKECDGEQDGNITEDNRFVLGAKLLEKGHDRRHVEDCDNRDSSKVQSNRLEKICSSDLGIVNGCDGSLLMEMIIQAAKTKVSVMGFGRVCSEVGANSELELHALVEVSKERDKVEEISSKDSSNVCGNEDYELEKNLSSDVGMEVEWVGSIFEEETTIMAKTNASGESVKEDLNLICLEVDESQDGVNGGEMNLVFEFQDCVKGGETDLEMVMDNKEDGEFVHESEEIELFDHCSMNMVESKEEWLRV